MTATNTAAPHKAQPAPKAAIALLEGDHEAVSRLFAEYDEATVEPDGEMVDAKVKVLSEHVKHHVEQVQTEMFPKAKASSLDLVELGARLAARNADLMDQAA